MNKSNWKDYEAIKANLEDDAYSYLSRILNIFFESIRAINYHRAISVYIKEQSDGWNEDDVIYIYSTSLDIAVLTWAKLFGSEASQDTHFMHLMKYDDFRDCLIGINISSKEQLEQNLLSSIKVSKIDFDEYKENSIIKYRDKHVAHMDLHIPKEEALKNYPRLEIARDSLLWLYSFIVGLLECIKSQDGNRGFAIYKKDVIEGKIKNECDKLMKSLKHRD